MIIQWHRSFDAGELAWILGGTAGVLVLLWPGLTLFYCGLLGRPAPAGIAGRWLALGAVLSLAWGLWGYSLAFAPSWGTMPVRDPDDVEPVYDDFRTALAVYEAREDLSESQGRGGVVGGPEYLLMRGVTPEAAETGPIFPARRPHYHLPQLAFASFQMMVLLAISAPLAAVLCDRERWAAVVLFAAVWSTIVYAPLVHSIWGDGWLSARGALDFGGGLLHTGLGFSALACALLPARRSSPEPPPLAAPVEDSAPVASNPALANLGAALVWGGALVLHACAAWKPDGRAANALLNSHLAASAGLLAWIVMARFLGPHMSRFPSCAGAVAGLAAIAPGCGLILPQSAIVVGVLAGALACVTLETLHRRVAANGAWSVFVIHGIAGALGLLFAGIFATSSAAGLSRTGGMIEGLVGGNPEQVSIQALAAGAAAGWALAATLLVRLAIRWIPIRE